jgi:hypothetical protein
MLAADRQESRSVGRGAEHIGSIALSLIVAVSLVLLARGLPDRTFFSGGSGVKLIAVRNAIDHPTHPLDIELPRVGNQPVAFVDPFFRVHGGHAHAATPDVFPLLSAPLVALFGNRGAFVLPAFGYLLTIVAIAFLGVALDESRSPTTLLFVSVACTPLLFYGLEFWEHSLAAGVAGTGTVLYVERSSRRVSLLMSGVLFGIATLLRPEAAWFAVAVVAATRWLPHRVAVTQVATVAAGAALTFLPFAALSSFNSGELFGAHLSRNMSGLASHWWAGRIDRVNVWFGVNDAWWVVVGAGLFVAAAVAMNSTSPFIRVVTIIGGTFTMVASVAAATGEFERASVWNVAPAVLAVFVIPVAAAPHGRVFLFTVSMVSATLVCLTAPNDGGAQWGPRFLCLTFIPLGILIADALTATVRVSRVVGTAVLVVILASSILVQRNAYRNLQSTKRIYERIVKFVERESEAGSYILTDLWYFDQVTAGLYPTRVVLFVNDLASTERAFRLLKTVDHVFVARSENESGDALSHAPEKFAVTRQVRVPERSLTLTRLVNTR